ncbi:CHAT domain-containing protein [Kribbella sp. NBC_01505]|uniref:CHAT domain-containing protein n=1 Tax=Kribbella sp. NBC_01505 TaxID=2903580 RepID=UPI003865BE76
MNAPTDEEQIVAALSSQPWSRTGHLSLRRLGLRTLPDQLPEIAFLTSLDLSGNRLGRLPAWFQAAARLQRLLVAGNRLTALPDEIGQMTALEVLDASDNRLQSIPATIRNCHDLRRIDVSGNSLRDCGPLAQIPALLILDAGNNRLSAFSGPIGPPTLATLDLSRNGLVALPAGFEQLTALRRLDLSGNRLTSEALGSLAGLPLEELYLDDNQLDTAVALPEIARVSAAGNPATPEDGIRDAALAILRASMGGGPDPERNYYDLPPSSFDLRISIPRAADTQRVVDLYYKRFADVPATVRFDDGFELALGAVSRRTALESVQERQGSGTAAALGVLPSKARVERSEAFLVQSLARITSADLLRPGFGPHSFEQTLLTPSARVLNVALTDSTERVLLTTAALRTGQTYAVRIDLGPLADDSVIINPVALRADDLTSDDPGGYRFDLVVSSSDVDVEPRLHRMTMPLTGASAYTYVPFTTGERAGPSSLRVTLYHRNNVVQSVRVDFVVTQFDEGTGQIQAIVDFALTDDAASAPELPPRQLNVLTNDSPAGTHTIVVNDGVQAITATVSDLQATTVLTAVRYRLTEITLGGRGDKSRYDDQNRKPTGDFIDDLRRMALSGAQLWQAVVPDVSDRARLREHLANRAKIQVTRATRASFPWALVYDIPRDPEQDGTLCSILTDWDVQQDTLRDYPSRCPGEASHGLNVICPYGFWGFRHLIEQPPSVRTGTLRSSIKVVEPARAAAARSLALNPALTAAHFTDLEACLAGRFELVHCADRPQLVAALSDPQLPLAYFYCHGRTEVQADVVTPYLEIGTDTRIAPGSIGAWHEAGGWGSSHWSETAPLVFINGCETAALQASDVVSFVDAFAGLHAAGVVGTEIAVAQRVAGEIALRFYRHFVGTAGASVGTALHRTRIDLLRKGNITGLVYTPFCSADLTLERF